MFKLYENISEVRKSLIEFHKNTEEAMRKAMKEETEIVTGNPLDGGIDFGELIWFKNDALDPVISVTGTINPYALSNPRRGRVGYPPQKERFTQTETKMWLN